MKPVAIVARGGTNSLAPFRDPNWEIWGLPWIAYPRVDRVFELHSEKFFEESPPSWVTEQKWLQSFHERHPDAVCYCDPSRMHRFKNAVEYPIEEVIKNLPIVSLENSISYMLAQAILEKRPKIGLFGVHMFAGREAEIAQASVMYLTGLAHGRGIEVFTPLGSPLFMSNYVAGRYGINGGPKQYRKKIICYAGVVPYE